MAPELWTIGHGARPLDEFLHALHARRIEVLADVRQFPGSRKHPHFGQAPLRAALEQAGIRYEHFVDLGGFRSGGYEAYMETPAWQAAFAALAARVLDARVAVMCAETVPWRCHRRFIAAHAMDLGCGVTHILDAKRTLPGRRSRQGTLDETED